MDVTISAGFSGRPYDLRMRIYTIENNVGANYSRYHGDRYGYSRSGWGSYANNAYTVDSWIAGWYAGGAYSLPFAPGDYAGKTISFGSYDTGAVGHDGNGGLYFTSRIRMLNASIFGSADTGDVGMYGDLLPRPPAAPTPIGIDQVSTTSFRYRFSGNGNGGSPITGYQVQVATNAAFTTGVETIASSGTSIIAARTPNTPYWVRSRGNNAYWNGAWSAALAVTTLPAVAPGLAIAPSFSGTQAVVTFTPPGGATGVTEYNLERRLQGTTTATATTSTTVTKTISGLTPGAIYEWRANAEFGTYTSPWTAWTAATQPNPNTNPGDYFDGSTAPRDDLTFSWRGAVNNSVSDATGVGADGWAVANGAGGGTLRLQRVTGGRSGQYAARMLVLSDLPAVGGFLGMNFGDIDARAEVEPDALYVGSIYARPSRAQRLAVEIVWVDAAGVEVGIRPQSTPVVVTDLVGWTRLSVSGVAPTTAATAVVRVKDATGTGFVTWKSGEWLDADDAMVSLGVLFDWFSGDTPDAPGYDYQWLDLPNASQSARFEVAVAADNPLADPDCPAPPAPPSLPTIPSDCIDEVGTWRRYSLQIPASEVRQWMSTLPTLLLSTEAAAERQVRIRYWPNPLNDSAAAMGGSWESEQILTYLPPNTDLRLDGVTQRATAEVNGGGTIPADELLYGTGGTPATWPELRCGIGYVVTMDVPLEAPAGNLSARVIVTQRM